MPDPRGGPACPAVSAASSNANLWGDRYDERDHPEKVSAWALLCQHLSSTGICGMNFPVLPELIVPGYPLAITVVALSH